MKYVKYCLIAICFGLFLFTVSAVNKAIASDPPESVTIDYVKATKPAVVFPHKKHVDAGALKDKCNLCHVNPDGTGGLQAAWKTKPANMAEAMKHPAHATACKTCHTTAGKGPTGCADCHK